MPIRLTQPLPDIGMYCLTVKDTKRCSLQHDQAYKNKLPVQFVYGRKFDDDSIRQDGGDLSDPRWSCLSMFGNNPGYIYRAYSCAAGHRDILRQFINSNHTHALVFEDDYLCPVNIAKVAHRLVVDYPNQHYFNLNTEAFIKKKRIPVSQDINNLQIKYQNQAAGSGMYLIDRYFAQHALEHMLNPLHLPADAVTWIEWSPIQKIAVVYGTGVALSEENINSLIGYGTQQ